VDALLLMLMLLQLLKLFLLLDLTNRLYPKLLLKLRQMLVVVEKLHLRLHPPKQLQ